MLGSGPGAGTAGPSGSRSTLDEEAQLASAGPQFHLRAPFCSVGDDCFEDVNHPRIAMDIKRLALALSAYMRNRMAEENAAKYNHMGLKLVL